MKLGETLKNKKITLTNAKSKISEALFNNLPIDMIQILTQSVNELQTDITNIESGAFDSLPYVFYIYVHPDNPAYSSDAGILYTKDMSTLVAYPSCR